MYSNLKVQLINSGGEWKKCWVVVIRIIGSKSAASPPSMKCPRCDTILSPPTETVNRIIASKQKLQPAVRCSSCSQPLRVPLSIPDDIFELAIYQSSNDATPVRTYSLKGAVSNPVANPKSTFVPNGVTNFAQSMVFSQKSDNSSYYARRNILFGFESRQIRDAFVGSFSSEPRRVIEYYPDINGSSTASSAASSASSSSSSSSSNNLVLSPSEEKRNAYVPSSAVAAASIDWVCPTCTYINHAPASATRVDCEMCRSECTPVAATATAPPTAPRPNFNNRSNTSSGSSGSGTQGASVVAPPSAPLVEAQVIDESTVSGSTQYPMAAVVANVVAPQFVGNADGGRRRSANFDDEIDAFICPITSEIMTDPVMTCDGFTYERSAITEWFQRNRGNPTSPITGERLENTTLVPNHSLRRAIDQYRAQLGISGTSASRGGNTGASASSSTSASITLT